MKQYDLSQVWKDYAKCYAFFYAPLLFEAHKEVVSRVEGRKIADLGCGVGKLLSHLKNFEEYVGVDSNTAMLNEAKKSYGENPNIFFIHGDVCKSDLSNEYFSSVISINVLYSLGSKKNVESAIKEAHRILQKEGVFIVMNLNNKLNSQTLEEKIKKQCQQQVVDENSEKLFNVFLKCNKILISQLENYHPQLFEIDDMLNLLFSNGFSNETQKPKSVFDDMGYVLSVKKIK